jgi:SAM-dependent methyltransferase
VDRVAKILFGIERGMRVLELGPSFSPIASKEEGWNVCTVDHAPRGELVEKYRDDPSVDTSRIEEVDVVWSGGPLDEALPVAWHGSFDACIASHLLEHIPDPIGLFRSLEQVLAPAGIVSLALPDKRFCFDYFKPLSYAGDVLDAHVHGLTRHRVKTLFDYVAYGATSRGEPGWSRRPVTDLALVATLDEAKEQVDAYIRDESEGYVDCHAWHFTPSSFELLMLELGALELIYFSIAHSFPTEGFEFFVTLRRGRAVPGGQEELQAERLRLLRRTMQELADQTSLFESEDAVVGAERR